MQDIWLMFGDCLEKMKDIPSGSVDIVIADLPYGTTACEWDIVIPFEPMWDHYWRVLKDNGVVALFGSEPFSTYLRMSQIKYYKYDWYWKKNRGGFVTAKLRPLSRVETISVFYKKQPTYLPIFEEYSDSTKERFWKNPKRNANKAIRESKINSINNISSIDNASDFERGRYPDNIKEFKVPNPQNEERLHPTQKPVDLLEYLIKTYTNEGEIVLDNTMGSGSTGIACLNTRRKFIGIEKDETYFNIAKRRIEDPNFCKESLIENNDEDLYESMWN